MVEKLSIINLSKNWLKETNDEKPLSNNEYNDKKFKDFYKSEFDKKQEYKSSDKKSENNISGGKTDEQKAFKRVDTSTKKSIGKEIEKQKIDNFNDKHMRKEETLETTEKKILKNPDDKVLSKDKTDGLKTNKIDKTKNDGKITDDESDNPTEDDLLNTLEQLLGLPLGILKDEITALNKEGQSNLENTNTDKENVVQNIVKKMEKVFNLTNDEKVVLSELLDKINKILINTKSDKILNNEKLNIRESNIENNRLKDTKAQNQIENTITIDEEILVEDNSIYIKKHLEISSKDEINKTSNLETKEVAGKDEINKKKQRK